MFGVIKKQPCRRQTSGQRRRHSAKRSGPKRAHRFSSLPKLSLRQTLPCQSRSQRQHVAPLTGPISWWAEVGCFRRRARKSQRLGGSRSVGALVGQHAIGASCANAKHQAGAAAAESAAAAVASTRHTPGLAKTPLLLRGVGRALLTCGIARSAYCEIRIGERSSHEGHSCGRLHSAPPLSCAGVRASLLLGIPSRRVGRV